MSDAVFEGDVLLALDENGADIAVNDALVACDRRFDTAVLLSLFGGNIEDDGKVENNLGWWGNYCGNESERNMTSRFQAVVNGNVLSVLSAKNAIEAAKNDLKWLKDSGAADEIEVSGEIAGNKKFSLCVVCKKNSAVIAECRYALNWEDIRNGLRK